jgi:3-deoxy-D-manno-octulosonic-acid transferase
VWLWLYSLAAHALRLVAWPALWWLGRRTPGYRERWAERRARAPLPVEAREGIVVHAVSMGEVAAATPIVEGLLQARPDLPIIFTCTTPTASALIRERFGTRVHHCYLPFDTPGAVRRFLGRLAPRLLLIMETELWPNLLAQAEARGIAVIVAGGRLSQRSAQRYARWPSLTGALLAQIDLLLVQDAAARERFIGLGAAPRRVRVTGSPKFDTPLPPGAETLRARFAALTAGRWLWVAASTHEGEEDALLDALPALRERWPQLLLVLAPRHPQRFDDVAALLERSGLRWRRRSAVEAGEVLDATTAVLLGDTMGELRSWFALARLVFIGGSLIERGGHSPLEAMAFGAPIVSGPHVFNFADVFLALQADNAVAVVPDAPALAATVQGLLAEPDAAQAMGARALAFYEEQRGATARTLQPVLDLLERLAPVVERRNGQWLLRADASAWAAVEAQQLDREARLFDASAWPAQETVVGSGRGSARFVRAEGIDALLRHYRRGGQAGRWLGDRYLRRAAAHTRALAEFTLLRRLRSWGLAVPRPLAAGVRRSGLVDRCDMLVERIDGGSDLWHRMQRASVGTGQWERIGEAIGQLHAYGVDHRDLNCHNLVLDGNEAVWIVDFDRCLARSSGPWQASNLERLLRSLRKESGRCATWHWNEAGDWAALRRGYERATSEAAVSSRA